ncbi:MAG: hypothetical protein NTW11_01740 [Candidatus Staskawiczbacteria bacterium]|nr:hypothetical protein [Candidatus Staskawiczbacteria bacterium]
MINLLPQEEKQGMIAKSREKLSIIWGIVIFVALICLTLILLSIRFYILAETDYQKNILSQIEKDVQTADFKKFNSIIQKNNLILTQIDSFYKNEIYFSKVSKIITDVSGSKALHITGLSLNRKISGGIQASVSGISDTRDDLLAFKKNINEDGRIVNPYFSPGSWVSSKNAQFTLTFEIDKNDK